MKCHLCGDSATVHLTEIVQQKKTELHLCDACAEKHQILAPPPTQDLNVQAVLHLLMGQSPDGTRTELICPQCGLQYEEFRATGRFGCPHDYDAFRSLLEPLLERIHIGALHQGKGRHHGKHPHGTRVAITDDAGRSELLRRLRTAIEAEEYEEAAGLRDLIRRKDATDDEPG